MDEPVLLTPNAPLTRDKLRKFVEIPEVIRAFEAISADLGVGVPAFFSALARAINDLESVPVQPQLAPPDDHAPRIEAVLLEADSDATIHQLREEVATLARRVADLESAP